MTSRLDEIKKRAEAASPGPWVVKAEHNVMGARRGSQTSIATCGGHSDNRRSEEVHEENVSNAAFIAHAREDFPWLLAQLAAALKVVEAARVVFPPDHVGRKTWSKEGRAVADALAEYDAAKRRKV